MKLGVQLSPGAGEAIVDPVALSQIVSLLDEVGVESLWVGEHAVVPESFGSAYPGSPTGALPYDKRSPFPSPLVWLAYVAALSHSLRLGTQVLILPHHNPVLLAKEAATLDRLAGGRLELGVGLGWCAEEAAIVGYDFADRGALADEAIDVMRQLWASGDHPAGRFWRFEGAHSHPQPRRAIPIVIGGSSMAAARRAGRVGDGYFPYVTDPTELSRLVAAMHDEAGRHGRDGAAVEVTCPLLDVRPVDGRSLVDRLLAVGVGRVVIPLHTMSPTEIGDVVAQALNWL